MIQKLFNLHIITAPYSDPGISLQSRLAVSGGYSTALLPRIFPAACGGNTPLTIDLPLRRDSTASQNISTWSTHLDRVTHNISIDAIFGNPFFKTWIVSMIIDPEHFFAPRKSF